MNPIRVPRLPWRDVDGRAIVLHPRRGEVHELSTVATFVWSRLDGSCTTAELVQAVCENFETDPAQAAADTSALLDQLVQNELIEWASRP